MRPVTFLSEQGLIFRFKFLMLITLACAAMTVIFFIVSQVRDGSGLAGRASAAASQPLPTPAHRWSDRTGLF